MLRVLKPTSSSVYCSTVRPEPWTSGKKDSAVSCIKSFTCESVAS